MPAYLFHCKACGEDFRETLRIDNRNDPIDNDCPSCDSRGHIARVIEAPNMIYNPSGNVKTSDNFNDRLIEINKTKGKDSTINTRRSVI